MLNDEFDSEWKCFQRFSNENLRKLSDQIEHLENEKLFYQIRVRR